MRFLITRPERPAARTAARLAAMGHTALADPLLAIRFTPPARLAGGFDGVVATSANALRAVAGHPDLPALARLPLWAVGERTAEAAREAGFAAVHMAEGGDGLSLAELLRAAHAAGTRLLYLAAADRSQDIAALVAPAAIAVETVIVYHAEPATALAPATREALLGGTVDCVLHYSRRTAGTYLRLLDAAGIGAAGLAPLQLCLSEQVAAPVRLAGAPRIAVAPRPDEASLLGLIEPRLANPPGAN